MVKKYLFLFLILLFLGACASRLKDQMQDYRQAYAAQDFNKAAAILEKSDLKKEEKSLLLWHLEKGTLSLSQSNEDEAITHFQRSLELIDEFYTTRLSKKAASLLVNDLSDQFYGANYERSYAHYFLAKSLYSRFKKSNNKLDLQGARATILAWDSYFADLQRSSSYKTLYQTDLMLKIFGGEIHEVSKIRNDKQIALQLYKDALGILHSQGGIFSVFNKSSTEYIKDFESEGKANPKLYVATPAKEDLEDFLHLKILSLTKEIRPQDYSRQLKDLGPKEEIKVKALQGSGNVVLVLEEGLIPQKTGKPFNFGIKGAINSVNNKAAKAFIATVGAEVVTAFAMNKLGMIPERTASPGSFIFAHDVTRLAVQEAAIEFELPMIDNVPLVQRLSYFILDEKGVIIEKGPLPIVSENGDLARVVLEEDVVARYVKTGTRVAIKHLIAIVSAMKLYQTLKKGSDEGGDFLAKTAALATYVGASKGIAVYEKADTRHWTTLPQALRVTELKLPPGAYQLGIGLYSLDKAPDAPSKILGSIQVKDSEKSIFTFKFNP